MKKEYDLKKLRKRRGKVKIDPGAAKVPVSSPSTRLLYRRAQSWVTSRSYSRTPRIETAASLADLTSFRPRVCAENGPS